MLILTDSAVMKLKEFLKKDIQRNGIRIFVSDGC